ncbi:ABC transporter permease protein YxdM [Paraliobacillus ryukyuensis]|uniref:Putative ABC transport system permease protein n=1 Tax=Paraliobacillus ryukyuensis TaxID=200904 RepID=A0A366E6L5_9BACI|nr:FtsX-like permease family protein [Paraliobacillus ryukyuensis]RBO97134.1 putative ABC transport system permease protein [Paraliobacillus ryukyuensis]
MTFRQFAFKNVWRNKRTYIAYFLSSMFTVMVFFTFGNFAFHPTFGEGSLNQNVLLGMTVAGGIIYVFSFFFILYSMSAFLQSRKKEFGLLMTLGASTKQVRLIVFLENILIGFFATVGGILLGLLFSKAILLIAENILIIDESLDFYFPIKAIVITLISFLLLFLFISFFVSFFLRTNKLVDLIKGDQQPKNEPKASVLLSIVAALLLISGYVAALIVKGIVVVSAMIPVIIVVTIGTYLLFTQLSVFLIRSVKRNKAIFWKKTNMLLLSDLSFRLKDNARTFFMVAMISTVAFSAIGSLYGFQSILMKDITDANPYSIEYVPNKEDSQEIIEDDMRRINATLVKENVTTEMESIRLSYFQPVKEEEKVLIVRASEFNNIARLIGENTVSPAENEAIVVEANAAVLGQETNAGEKLMEATIKLTNGDMITPKKVIESEAISELNGYYVVNDDSYDQLGKPENTYINVVWQAKAGQENQLITVGEKLNTEVPTKVFVPDYQLYEINKFYGPILFIGLFIGIVFFVAAGSFLYFRLFTDMNGEKQKFRSIAKIGLKEFELKKVVNRQISLLFFAPIVVAIIHGGVALTALSHLFNHNLLKESFYVLGSFACIQIIYFLVVRYFYMKQLKRAIF